MTLVRLRHVDMTLKVILINSQTDITNTREISRDDAFFSRLLKAAEMEFYCASNFPNMLQQMRAGLLNVSNLLSSYQHNGFAVRYLLDKYSQFMCWKTKSKKL